jgi:hypothetical protein
MTIGGERFSGDISVDVSVDRASAGGQHMASAIAAGEIDTIAWQFLSSVYTGRDYWDWPLDRRIDAYLRHLSRTDVLNDGAAYSSLIERVMANIARARRDGLLDRPGSV